MDHRNPGARRTRRIALHAILAAAIVASAIGALGGASRAVAAGEAVNVTLTTNDLSKHLSPQTAIAFSAGAGTASTAINLNEGRTFQKMVGFGATFTDSSAWLMYDKTSTATRAAVMQDLFSTTGANGIGLNYLRQPMSATDYIKTVGGYYTYDDMPSGQTDPTLANFSIAHDLDYLIPILKQAIQINPAIKVQLNSWTAPAWMKDNNSLVNGGHLLPQYNAAWSNYIVKAIQAYQAQGVPVWSTTVLNEPYNIVRDYPTMELPASQAGTIIRDSLAPGLAAAGLTTRILAGDDSPFSVDYTASVIDSDPLVNAELPGISSHGYFGSDPAALTTLHNLYPNKDIYQTELAAGCAEDPISTTMKSTRNWGSTMVTWNVALDPSNGPYHSTASNTCKPLVVVDQATGATTYTKYFYQEGQVSKFVKPGAVRFDSNDNANVRNVAFKNPDGSKALLAWNSSSSSQTFSVNWGNQHFDYTLAAGAIATFTWGGTVVGDPSGWGNSTFGTSSNPYGGGSKLGQWSITDAATATQNGLGGGQWPSLYYGYADHGDLTATADVRGVTAGTTAAFPKYGIYACYHDLVNFVQAWIDPTSGNFVTHAVASGTDLGYSNTALPGGFVSTTAHRITVQKTGTSFSFQLDGTQQQTRVANVGNNCQLGLVTEDYKAAFSNVSLVDPLRWGDSRAGSDASNSFGGGLKRGDWEISGPDSATANSIGSGWSSLYRGYLQGNQTVTVAAQGVKAGTTSSFPKYGIYAAYLNASNYVQGWIDPTSGNFVTHAVVAGSDLGYTNNALPGGFNAHAFHTIAVTRTGDSFAFSLDGTAQQTRTAAVGQGQVGLVSEDYQANFRKLAITSDPGTPAFDPNAWYHIYNRKSLRQLSVLSGGTANSTSTIIYDPVNATDQLWQIKATGGGYYQLINQRSGRALSVLSGGTANSTSTIIYDNISATDQYWAIAPAGDGSGYLQLTNQRSGRALSVLTGGTVNSTNTIIYDYISAPDQDWVITPAP